MSNLERANLVLGGRLSAFADAYLQQHYAKAGSIAADLRDDCGIKSAEATGVIDPEDEWSVTKLKAAAPVNVQSANQSCMRGAHDYAPRDNRGWRVCSQCGYTRVTPMEGDT